MTMYAFDFRNNTFWPMTLGSSDYDPKVFVEYEPLGTSDKSDLIWGCDDGYPRQFDNTVFQDDGTAFTSYVVYGPMVLGQVNEWVISELDGAGGVNSGDIDWELYVGNTMEGAADTSGAAVASGTWVAGPNTTARPRVRGNAFTLRLDNGETNDGWFIEEIDVRADEKGRRRV